MARRLKIAIAAGAAAALALTLVACAPGGGEGGGGDGTVKEGGVINVGTSVPRAAPEPVTMYDPGSIDVVQPVLEYLLFVENDGTLSPRLATDFGTDDEGKTWTFDLREGVTYTDGSPFSSADVIAMIERIIGPDSVSAAKGAFAGLLEPGSTVAEGDHKVIFNLERPFAEFPYLVSSGNYNTVIPKADYSGDFLENPIGTGPFTMTAYVPNASATYVANEDYWNAEEVYLDGVNLQFFADMSATTGALLSGSLDLVSQLTYFRNAPLFEGDQIDLLSTEVSLGSLIAMRTDMAPFDDIRVRQAMAFALDREELAFLQYGSLGIVGNDGLWTAQFPEDVNIEPRPHDPERSKELLAEAGYPDGLAVTLTVPAETSKVGELVQAQANEAGFDVTLDVMDTNTFYGDAWLNVPFGITGWAARPAISPIISVLYVTDAVWNTAHWSNPEFDALAAELEGTVDPDRRSELAQQMDEILTEELPQLIPFSGLAVQGTAKYVEGYKASQFVQINLVGVWLDK